MMNAPLLFLPAGFICVGARGHISTEPDNEDWLEGPSSAGSLRLLSESTRVSINVKLFGRYSEHQTEIFDPPTVGGPADGNAISNVNFRIAR